MIQTNTQLDAFLLRIENETELAIDTEFKWVSTYYPILCLIQIATENVAECIDILAIENPQPLFDKLYRQDSLWIAHAARNDIETLYQLSGQLPKQVFDTQIAVDLLKHLHPDGSQISYQALTELLQGVVLEKAYTRLDWTIRPLPKGAIEYALDDVRYLIKNYHQLKILLENEKKMEWIMEEGRSLVHSDLYEVDLFQAWKKVKGFSCLARHNRIFGVQLSAWRERQAIDKNKPRRWVMKDETLIDYALNKATLIGQQQQQFDEFLTTNPQLKKINSDMGKHIAPTAEEKARKKALQKTINNTAKHYNLDDKVIASGKTLLRYVGGDRSVNFLSGWRYQLLKEILKKDK
ncbi:Ribonuclease D [uncultured Candidatus Thioglobus sp.]|nr:Ribonuclease D [uncultured Candidatus Thioglobus sp.]